MNFSSEISFLSEGISFDVDNQEELIRWISETIIHENKILGELSYIFCSDEFLYQMNLEYLNHDTYTDIITFNYCEEKTISGDIFISIDRIKENSIEYNTSFENEMNRVIIHGVLHLIGYNDKTDEQQNEMTVKEDFYLSLYSK